MIPFDTLPEIEELLSEDDLALYRRLPASMQKIIVNDIAYDLSAWKDVANLIHVGRYLSHDPGRVPRGAEGERFAYGAGCLRARKTARRIVTNRPSPYTTRF